MITSLLLYHYLCETWQVTTSGKSMADQALSFPVFFLSGMKPAENHLYICRCEDLPSSCPVPCLFLCIGNQPSPIRHGWEWKGNVFYIENKTDILSLYNNVVHLFQIVTDWTVRMDRLMAQGADISALVQAGLPLFENCITISDYKLNLLVTCDVKAGGDAGAIEIQNDLDRIPDDVSLGFKDIFSRNIRMREPFLYTGQQNNPEGQNYCINLYHGDTYAGTCTLWDKCRPMLPRDFLLFQEFARYIRRALSRPSNIPSEQTIGMKSIFYTLVQCFPISREELSAAEADLQQLLKMNHVAFGHWVCITIDSANRDKQLPDEYLCAVLENMLPYTLSFGMDNRIICFSMIPAGDTCRNTICDILEPYLKDMNFRAGISDSFTDVFQSHTHYRQSLAMLKTGFSSQPERLIYPFSDFILPYMLEHCAGEFDKDMIFTEGLRALKELDTGVDYRDTLKRYLDNECNASKTAQELYLHRSTLQPRLEKIRTLADMDTPEGRLYLRICIYLEEYLDSKKRK